MTAKRIATIIMCAALVLMIVMTAVVYVKVFPVINVLLEVPDTPGSSETNDEETPDDIPDTEDDEPDGGEQDEPDVEEEPDHEHVFSTLKSQIAPACETPGQKIYACSCGKTKVEGIPALGHGHNGVGQLVSATCTTDGYTKYTCPNCGMEYQRDITKALGHDWVKGETVAPTCTEDGYTPYTCSRANCPEKTKQEDKVTALGHSFGQWELTTEPESGKPGEESRECDHCEHIEKRKSELLIPADGITKTAEGTAFRYEIFVVAKDTAGQDVQVYCFEVTDQGGLLEEDSFQYGEEGLMITIESLSKELVVTPETLAVTINDAGELVT